MEKDKSGTSPGFSRWVIREKVKEEGKLSRQVVQDKKNNECELSNRNIQWVNSHPEME